MSDYYHLHAEAYHEATFHINPESFLRPLADRLSPGALILDVGCGSGRDLGWLRHRGYRAVGLARDARENHEIRLRARFRVRIMKSVMDNGINTSTGGGRFDGLGPPTGPDDDRREAPGIGGDLGESLPDTQRGSLPILAC